MPPPKGQQISKQNCRAVTSLKRICFSILTVRKYLKLEFSISSFKYFRTVRIEKQIRSFVFGRSLLLDNFVLISTDLYQEIQKLRSTFPYISYLLQSIDKQVMFNFLDIDCPSLLMIFFFWAKIIDNININSASIKKIPNQVGYNNFVIAHFI